MNNRESQYTNALEVRNTSRFKDTIKAELVKSEWQDELKAIDERLKAVQKVEDFKNITKDLKNLFDQIYEKITTPGLDSFINWLKGLSRNDKHCDAFKRILKQNYESHAIEIDAIITSKEELQKDSENSIFKKLLKAFDDKIESKVKSFIDKKENFESLADSLMSDLQKEFEGMLLINELKARSIDELYSEDQKNDTTLSYYSDIFNVILEKHQMALTKDSQQDIEKLHEKVKKRISSVKKCIKVLADTNMSKEQDEVLSTLFITLQSAMPIAQNQSYEQALNEFITFWDEIKSNYNIIKAFYDAPQMHFSVNTFDGLKSGKKLEALISDYENVRGTKVLLNIRGLNAEGVKSKINEGIEAIKSFNSSVEECRAKVKEEFENFLKAKNQQKAMLQKAMEKCDEDTKAGLQKKFNSIYSEKELIYTIGNGIQQYLSENNNFLNALSEGVITSMIKMENKANIAFEDILKESGLKESIEWLNSLGNNVKLSTATFDAEKLNELLDRGLISLLLTKTYN